MFKRNIENTKQFPTQPRLSPPPPRVKTNERHESILMTKQAKFTESKELLSRSSNTNQQARSLTARQLNEQLSQHDILV